MRVRLALARNGIDPRGIVRDLESFGRRGQIAARKALGEVVAKAVPRAKQRTPVDDVDGGQLRDSVRATRPTARKDGTITAALVAGGEPLRPYLGGRDYNAYAIVQETDASLKHRTGQAGFLSDSIREAYPTGLEHIRQALDVEAAKTPGSGGR